MCSSIFSCCFPTKQLPPLPRWTESISPEAVKALGGEANIAKFPVYDHFITLNSVKPHLTPDDLHNMDMILKTAKKNIGVFRIDEVNIRRKTEEKTHVVFIRVMDRYKSKATYEMYGICIETTKVYFAFTKSNETTVKEQTGPDRFLPVGALIKGNSLGAYDASAEAIPDESDPIIAGHEGRIYLADPDPSHLL